MQFFNISVILYFFLWICFIFFSPKIFSQPSLNRFSPSLSLTCLVCDLFWVEQFLKSSKTTSRRLKTSKNRSNFRPAVTFSLVVTKRLKFFWKTFLWWHLFYTVLNLSENIFATVQIQNNPVFSITWLNGTSRNTDFDGYYIPNRP
jgi:hypothetical protein